MKEIAIGNRTLTIKDYYCSENDEYIVRDDGKLWLYIHITDRCNAGCPFCVNSAVNKYNSYFDVTHLESVLKTIAPFVYGVSITGGEPMLFPNRVDEVAEIVNKIFDSSVELDLVTNGTRIDSLLSLKMLERFQSIHISRHSMSDSINTNIMNFQSPTLLEIEKVVSNLDDKAKIVLNCVMQKGGVENAVDMAAYLEAMSEIGIRNVSFVGLFLANSYCKEHYISLADIDLSSDDRFCIWNRFKDHNICSCSSGSFISSSGSIRYYYRCPGNVQPLYSRQLVYTADNKILDGFNGNEITL